MTSEGLIQPQDSFWCDCSVAPSCRLLIRGFACWSPELWVRNSQLYNTVGNAGPCTSWLTCCALWGFQTRTDLLWLSGFWARPMGVRSWWTPSRDLLPPLVNSLGASRAFSPTEQSAFHLVLFPFHWLCMVDWASQFCDQPSPQSSV